jgi:predicted molibdopterin-dependent oxidoreductase YjgC
MRQSSLVRLEVDGVPLETEAGRNLAAALIAAGIRGLRRSPRLGLPRGAFCMMGVCQECLIEINGVIEQACLTPVAGNMIVKLDRTRG